MHQDGLAAVEYGEVEHVDDKLPHDGGGRKDHVSKSWKQSQSIKRGVANERTFLGQTVYSSPRCYGSPLRVVGEPLYTPCNLSRLRPFVERLDPGEMPKVRCRAAPRCQERPKRDQPSRTATARKQNSFIGFHRHRIADLLKGCGRIDDHRRAVGVWGDSLGTGRVGRCRRLGWVDQLHDELRWKRRCIMIGAMIADREFERHVGCEEG